MSYALASLWHDWMRYVPAMCAVCFSALLVALQCGMLLGTFSLVSIPVDHSLAEIWVSCPNAVSVDINRPIPQAWRSRLNVSGVGRSEPYCQGFGFWRKPNGAAELAVVIGSRLGPDSLGAVRELNPAFRARLGEPGTVVVDAADLDRLGISGVGSIAEVNGQRVRVVGLVQGLKGLSGPYLFCSLTTARNVLNLDGSQATFLLAQCRNGTSPEHVIGQLQPFDDMSSFTKQAFSVRSRRHWLLETGGGLALLAAAALGLIVGAAITSQTLFAAAAASMKEYAVLRAMGISQSHIAVTILSQALCVGLAGTALAGAVLFPLTQLIRAFDANVLLPSWLLLGAGGLTLAMALLAGLLALRSLRLADPVTLLR